MARLTQPLRFTASFPWSPRHSERKHCRRQYKTKRERCLSKLNSFSFSFCTCGAACAHSALVIPAGFEPTTHSLEGCCSIQLSYGTILWAIFSKCCAKVIHFFQIRYILSTNFRIKSNNRRLGRWLRFHTRTLSICSGRSLSSSLTP